MNLTDQQRAILEASGVSVAVAAGAGCGKTFVLTRRFIAYLTRRIGRENPLSGIVAITFTNKAAREMRQRLRSACEAELARAPAGDVEYWIGVSRALNEARISTIHAFSANLLRRFSVEAGIDPAFGMPDETLDGSMTERAVKDIYCDLLADGDDDARQLVVRLGLESAFDTISALLSGLRTHNNPARYDEMTPIELWNDWKTIWEEQAAPAQLREFVESPAAREILVLLREHEPSNQRMRERRANLLALLPNPPAFGVVEWLDEIIEAAQVQHTGYAKSWQSAEVYEEIKKRLKQVREDARALREPFQAAELPDEEAAALALQTHRVASRVLDRLNQRKRREGIVEFDDLLLLTRDLLRDRPDVARRASAGLELLMVDEFQDTDSVQAEIVRFLCGDAIGSGLLFLVGDAKQSIYRFRGADPRVFTRLRDDLPGPGHLPLSTNFRSQPAILRFVNYLFEETFPDDAPLDPNCPQLSPEPAVEFMVSSIAGEEKPSAEDLRRQEARWIAGRVAGLLADETPRIRCESSGALRRAAPGDIAILFRGLSNVAIYEQALAERALPYYLVNSRAFFMQQEILDIAHLCRWLADPADELSLVGVLRSPMFGLTDDTIFALKPERKRSLTEGIANPPDLPPQQAAQVRRTESILGELRGGKDRLGLADLLRLAIDRTAYDAALLTEHLGPRKLANLNKLVELARGFSESNSATLTDFAHRLQRAVQEETQEEVAPTHPEVGDVLRLMTIHQAKGLEFPIVVLADMDWKPRSNSDTTYHPALGPIFKVPRDDSFEQGDDSGGRATDATHLGQYIHKAIERAETELEAFRLLYVALTRSRDHLILSACLKDSESFTSPWLSLLARRFDLATGLPPVDPYLGAADGVAHPPETLPRVLVHREEPAIARPSRRGDRSHNALKHLEETIAGADPEPLPELLRPILVNPADRVVFAATDLTEFDYERRATPVASVVGDADRDPPALADREDPESRRIDSKTLGSLVHLALERLDFNTADRLDEDSLLRLIEKAQDSSPGEPNAALAASAREKIAALLKSPFPAELAAARRLHRELPFRLLWNPAGETRTEIIGIIDGLYQDARGRWHLYDYKITGRSGKTDEALADRYELQMWIYAMAIERSLGQRPASAKLIRLDEHAGAVTIELTAKRGAEAARRIDEAIQAARCSPTGESR